MSGRMHKLTNAAIVIGWIWVFSAPAWAAEEMVSPVSEPEMSQETGEVIERGVPGSTEKRPVTPQDQARVMSPDFKGKVMAQLSKDLQVWEANAKQLVEQSLSALTAGNGGMSVKYMEQYRAMLLRLGGGFNAGPIECKDKCKHHLDAGRPDLYAACWYSCLIFDRSGRPLSPLGRPGIMDRQ